MNLKSERNNRGKKPEILGLSIISDLSLVTFWSNSDVTNKMNTWYVTSNCWSTRLAISFYFAWFISCLIACYVHHMKLIFNINNNNNNNNNHSLFCHLMPKSC
jgi:hypothetical protein